MHEHADFEEAKRVLVSEGVSEKDANTVVNALRINPNVFTRNPKFSMGLGNFLMIFLFLGIIFIAISAGLLFIFDKYF